MKFEIVDDLSLIWKRWSVKIVAAQVVILATYGAMSVAGVAPSIPGWLAWTAFIVFNLAALTVAPLKQPNLPPQ